MKMLRYIAVRAVQTVFLLWVIVTFLFFLFRAMPGDMATIMAPAGASEEFIANFEAKWGLDEPISEQYYIHIVNYATLDFGSSMAFNEPVVDYVGPKIFNSVILVMPALTFAYILGSVIGTVTGYFRGTKIEKYTVMSLIAAGSLPGFFIGIILIIFFANMFDIFPTGGMLSPEVSSMYKDSPWWRPYLTKSFLLHYTLPFTAVLIRYLYIPTMIMRTSVHEVSNQDFVFYNRITGLPMKNQLWHIAKHASLPVISNYPLSIAISFGGMVLIEIVFNWPGIGFALVEAVFNRDLPVVMFIFTVIAFFIIISNFLVDLTYSYIDPRVSVTD